MVDQKQTTDQDAKIKTSKKYILVMEDDKFYGNIFKTKFQREGFDIDLAENGSIGMDIAHSRKPDIILLDLMMPVMNGFETLAELQNDPVLKDVPVIVLSNLGQKSDIEKTQALGAKDYLVKANVSLQEAVDKVKGYLKI